MQRVRLVHRACLVQLHLPAQQVQQDHLVVQLARLVNRDYKDLRAALPVQQVSEAQLVLVAHKDRMDSRAQ